MYAHTCIKAKEYIYVQIQVAWVYLSELYKIVSKYVDMLDWWSSNYWSRLYINILYL